MGPNTVVGYVSGGKTVGGWEGVARRTSSPWAPPSLLRLPVFLLL